MLKGARAFSGFSVDDLAAAKKFYGETLGLGFLNEEMGLRLDVAGPNGVFVYEKEDHVPATYTILNFVVDDIDQAVDDLAGKGVRFERYEGVTDHKGIARGRSISQGPDIAWFKDPAGNFVSVLKG
ncbi:MAG TPA: VOC family protein [Candidatus Dormibacteraeota bacterium]|nr:VOC family protein [Candidatus Dormibacteraeota bacterium]